MSRITKDIEVWVEHPPTDTMLLAPAALLPLMACFLGRQLSPWIFMWLLAGGIFFACKWLTFSECIRETRADFTRTMGYLFAWPGMNAREFFGDVARPDKWEAEFLFALTKIGFGGMLVWTCARLEEPNHPLIAGWIALAGFVFILHFGLFHLVALIWQRVGVNARPIMRAPILAGSVGEFWNCRWNVAFNQLTHRFVFRRLGRRVSMPVACLGAFLVSGLIHDLVISVPARGGYGLPTLYFLIQGIAVIFERSTTGRRLGLRHGGRGWIFMVIVTVGPVGLLFHPPFIHNVILPMLSAIGAIKGNL